MRFVITIAAAAIILLSCNDQQQAPQAKYKYSNTQKKLLGFVRRFKEAYSEAGNNVQKKELREKYLDSVHHYLVDSVHYRMEDFRVTVDDVDVSDIGQISAFHAKFYDSDACENASVTNTTYWMELDYSADSADKMKQNSTYLMLRNMNKGKDTTLNFMYLGQVRWGAISDDQLEIEAIPIPKEDFDKKHGK